MHPYPLTPGNRIRLAQAFRTQRHVDVAITCVVEGQMGQAFADDPAQPAAFLLDVTGFWYLAGDAGAAGAAALVAGIRPYSLIMNPPPAWHDLLRRRMGACLKAMPRYSFSSVGLDEAALRATWQGSPHAPAIRRIDGPLAEALWADKDSLVDMRAYASAADFVDRGLGYCLMDGTAVVGTAYASLVCSRAIEVSVVVLPPYRRQGAATALCAALLSDCLARHMDANWDAANPESCALARKLGYVDAGSYHAYYLTEAAAK
ncbi:MAG: GNAT family N-acetyltransferase [Anaerolineales bacterium]|nr:GNAT family N-acetyltransferase [Anaerolineales bacterium]